MTNQTKRQPVLNFMPLSMESMFLQYFRDVHDQEENAAEFFPDEGDVCDVFPGDCCEKINVNMDNILEDFLDESCENRLIYFGALYDEENPDF